MNTGTDFEPFIPGKIKNDRKRGIPRILSFFDGLFPEAGQRADLRMVSTFPHVSGTKPPTVLFPLSVHFMANSRI